MIIDGLTVRRHRYLDRRPFAYLEENLLLSLYGHSATVSSLTCIFVDTISERSETNRRQDCCHCEWEFSSSASLALAIVFARDVRLARINMDPEYVWKRELGSIRWRHI